MPRPTELTIYHIVHVDRLPSIIADGQLWCHTEVVQRKSSGTKSSGTTVGMAKIKARRLTLPLRTHPGLHVGDCVPFYFSPRSVMLYLIHRANHEALTYRGGQEPIVHLEANLNEAVVWAKLNQRMWAFTTSNASSFYFQEYSDLSRLEEIDWNAVRARDWRDCKEKKQAEFLVEHSFPWTLIRRIGVQSQTVFRQVQQAVQMARDNRPNVMIARKWYY